MVRSLPVLAVAALVPLLVACGDDSAGSDEAGDAPVVEVAGTGDGERRLFEIDVEEGHRETTTLTLAQAFDAGTGSTDAPRVTFVLESEVTGVEDDRVEITQTYVSFDVAGDDVTALQVEKALAPLRGLEGTVVLSPAGALLESDIEPPADLDPAIAQTFGQLEEQSASLGAAFPEEEIGEGAEWTAVTDLELSGIEVEQTTTYTLEKLDGDAYEISAVIEQEFEPGAADGFELEEGSGSGTASFGGTVGLLFATTGEGSAENTLKASSGDQEQTISTTVETSIETVVE